MKTIRYQTGFSTIAAIFLLVVLAALGAFMVTFSNTAQLNSAQDVQGSRAYWAARAGAEWAVGSIVASPAACPASPPASIEGFTLSVSCSTATYDEGGITRRLFRITSRATSGTTPGGPGYIEREVSVSMEV